LLPGQLTPRRHESRVRLGTWRPCTQAAEARHFFTGVAVSAPTVRRITAGAGAAYETIPTAAVERIERELSPAPPGPRLQRLRVEGAMVPLPPRAWAAVKTLASGTVQAPRQERGEWVVHTAELAYFSRLSLVETPRRGTETARTVWAVRDGAEWMQGFVDLHRPDAVRMWDFPHALGYVAHAGQAVYGEGTAAFTGWFTTPRQTLRHGDPGEVLQALQRLAATTKRRGQAQAVATVQESLGSLEKRRERLASAWCHARGYPLGSGRVESAKQLGVEQRLKGAGRPWARPQINPMVALRAMACSDRWAEAWPQIAQHVRHQAWQSRRQCHLTRQQANVPVPLMTRPSPQLVALPTAPPAARRRSPPPRPAMCPVSKGPYRPPPHHPWRRFRISWKSAQQTKTVASAKL
jgi:hypothetical protein